MGIFASDIETSGLLEQMLLQEQPKLHNLCSIDVDSNETTLFEGRENKAIQAWLDQGHTFIMHNGKCFDGEALKLLGFKLRKTKIIDSLALSWYLEPDRMVHGLAKYGEEFGIPKPEIEDWENQTQEEYNHRVQEDCKIQKMLWKRQVGRLKELYGDKEGSYTRIVDFLMQKMEELRQQQRNKWAVDTEAAAELQVKLEEEIAVKTDALRLAMPPVPEYVVRKRPKNPYKKNGELSEAGKKWLEVTKEMNLPFTHKEDIKVVKGFKEGNPGSPQQIKDWLYKLGWFPQTFKFIQGERGEEPRKIPQVNLKGGEVCESVKELVRKNADVEHIAGLGILNHRCSIVKGFLRDAVDGELIAGAQGFTNTLRMQHREIVNLPSLRVKYGKELRGLLVARKGKILLGSDLSSLEDRIKHHFQWHLDPDYVKSQMSEGFDPHCAIAVMAGLMTQDDADWYAAYKKREKGDNTLDEYKRFSGIDEIRAAGKSTNYACQYGAGVKTVARTAKVSDAVAKKLHAGYHKLNWSIAEIAKGTLVKETSFGTWQRNPINKFWYSLRSDKDRFSTLVQGTGSYIMDLWLFYCQKLAKERKLAWVLIGQFHDEMVVELDDHLQDEYRQLVEDALTEVNGQVTLNRELACDINFGYRYSDIH